MIQPAKLNEVNRQCQAHIRVAGWLETLSLSKPLCATTNFRTMVWRSCREYRPEALLYRMVRFAWKLWVRCLVGRNIMQYLPVLTGRSHRYHRCPHQQSILMFSSTGCCYYTSCWQLEFYTPTFETISDFITSDARVSRFGATTTTAYLRKESIFCKRINDNIDELLKPRRRSTPEELYSHRGDAERGILALVGYSG